MLPPLSSRLVLSVQDEEDGSSKPREELEERTEKRERRGHFLGISLLGEYRASLYEPHKRRQIYLIVAGVVKRSE